MSTKFALASKKYYYNNLEKERARSRNRYTEKRHRILLKKFNLTPEQYDHMLKEQNGLCAVCKNPESFTYSSGRVRSLAVDHSHKTGKVRKLLCGGCNAAFGQLKEDPTSIQSLLEYCFKYGDKS